MGGQGWWNSVRPCPRCCCYVASLYYKALWHLSHAQHDTPQHATTLDHSTPYHLTPQ